MPINDYTRTPLSWMPNRCDITYPQYLSLAALLERDILSGELPAGTKLPAQRSLADYLDLHFTTVTRAYDLCREKRLIYGEIGRGTFVAPRSRLDLDAQNIFELGVVLGFPAITQEIVETAREVLSRSYCRALFSYTERTGMEHQRLAAVQWMAKRGVHTDIEHTAVFGGAQSAITTALLSLFHMGDAIATDVFTYANLIGAARLAHIRLVPIAGDIHGMSPDALDAACRKSRITGIFLMPDCANPTTIRISESRRDELAAVCKKYDLIIIEDDASITPGKHHTFYARLPEQTFYIAAATRHLAPGLRITFAAFPDKWKAAITEGLYLTSIKASTLDAEIMSHLILSRKDEIILHKKQTLAIHANQIYQKIFPHDPQGDETALFFRMHPLVDHIPGRNWEAYALSCGVRVCHSYRFLVDKKPAPSFLRISLSSTCHMEELEHALLRLKEIEADIKV